MAPSLDDSSEYDSERRSQSGDTYAAHNGNGATYTSGTDGEQGEDLFIAAAVSPRGKTVEPPSRADRLRVSEKHIFYRSCGRMSMLWHVLKGDS
jgi:hypothetical protein